MQKFNCLIMFDKIVHTIAAKLFVIIISIPVLKLNPCPEINDKNIMRKINPK